MRILVLLACSIVLAAIGFVVYWTMQSPDGRQTVAARAQKHPVSMPTAGEGFGPGEKVWWNRYDAKGERTSRIRVSRYKPLKDGRFFVNDPECDFFLDKARRLHIGGKTGNFATQETLGKTRISPAGAGQNRSPRNGDLKDVILKVYPTEATTQPSMTITMNNASFDNETFRIETEDFEDEAGRRIPGDRVPIQARGDDDHPDFDGLGLKLQYNDVDRRLEYLKVFHGERLLIKHPGTFRRQPAAPTTRPAVVFIPSKPIEGIMLAAADKSAVRDAAPRPAAQNGAAARRPRPQVIPATRPKEEHPSPVYRAIFEDNVVVTQLDQRLATADEMRVDFVSESDELMSGPSTQPTTRSSTTRPTRGDRAAKPQRTSTTRPALASANKPTTKPTTRQFAATT